MEKIEIRKEFFKLKDKGHSYAQCKMILKAKYGFETTTRTLKRWIKRLDQGDWDLLDKSRNPNTIHKKINKEIEHKIITFRTKTGWGSVTTI